MSSTKFTYEVTPNVEAFSGNFAIDYPPIVLPPQKPGDPEPLLINKYTGETYPAKEEFLVRSDVLELFTGDRKHIIDGIYRPPLADDVENKHLLSTPSPELAYGDNAQPVQPPEKQEHVNANTLEGATNSTIGGNNIAGTVPSIQAL